MATDNLKGLTIEFGADNTKLSAALSAIERALKVTNKQLTVFKKNLKFDPGSLSSLEGQTDALRRKLAVTAQQAGLMRDAIGKVEGESSEIRRLAEETDNAALAAANARQQYNALVDRLAAYRDELDAAWSRMSGDKKGTFKGFEGEDLRNALELIRYEAERTGDAIAATVDEYEALSPKAKALQAELEKLNDVSGLQDLKANADAADSSIESLVARVRELGRQTDLERNEADLRRMDAAAEALNGELSKIDAALRLDPVNVEAVNAKMANLSEQAKLAEERTEELEKLLGKLSAKGVDDAGKSASVLAQELEEAEKKLQEASVKANRARGKLENLEQQMRIVGEIEGPDSDRYRKLAAEVDAASARYRELSAEAKEAENAADTAQMQSDMRRYRTEIIETTARMESMTREAKELQKHLGVSIPAGTIKQVGITLSSTISPAISMVGSSALQSAEDVDGAFRNMVKTVQGTDEQFEELRQSAIEFSQTNITSTSQLLQIEAMGGQLGIAVESLDEFAQTVSRLDIATNIDADTMAQQLGQLAGITDMAEDDFSKFADALVRLGNNSPTLESNIMDVAMRIGSMGTISGMSVPEILALATAVASTGQGAEAAGTAISNTMSDIETAVANGGESLQGFADVAGMSAEDFKALWQDDALGAIQAFVEGLERMESENKSADQALQNLGINGVRQKQALLGLAQTTDVLADSATMADDAWNGVSDQWGEAGDAAREADRKAEGFSGSMGILRNNLEVAGAAIGDSLIPFIDMLSAGIQTVTDAFLGLPQPVQTFISALGGVGIAAGPVMTLVGSVGEAWGKVSDKLAASGSKMGGVLLDAAEAAADAGKGIDDVAKSSAPAEKGIRKLGISSKTASIGLGMAKTAGLALGGVLAGIAVTALVKHFSELAERSKNLKKATEGLTSAMSAGQEAYLDADEGAGSYRDRIKEVREEVDALAEEQAGMADELTAMWQETFSNNAYTDTLQEQIVSLMELDEQGRLTADGQADLKGKIEELNGALGTSYSYVEGHAGMLWNDATQAWEARDAVSAYIDELQRLTTVKSLQTTAEEAYGAYEDAASKYVESIEAAQAAQDAYDEAVAGGVQGAALKEWADDLDEANAAVAEYKALMDSAAGTYTAASDQLTMAMDENASAFDKLLFEKMPLFQDKFAESGQKITEFSDLLEGSGVSLEQWGTLQDDQLARIAAAYDGSFSSISGLLDEFGISYSDLAESTYGDTAIIDEALGTFGTSLGDMANKAPEDLRRVVEEFGNTRTGVLIAMQGLNSEMLTEGQAAIHGYLDGFSSGTYSLIDQALSTKNLTLEQFTGIAQVLGAEGEEGIQALAYGIATGDQTVTDAVNSILADENFDDAVNDLAATGKQIPAGVAEGVRENLDAVTAALGELGPEAVAAANAALGIASPATTMIPTGEYIVQGIAEGIKNSTAIADAFAELAARIASEDNPIGQSIGQRIAQDAATAINEGSQPVVDAIKAIPGKVGDMTEAGRPIGQQMLAGAAAAVSEGASVLTAALSTFGTAAGAQLASGLASGISAGSGGVSTAATGVAERAAQAAAEAHSKFGEAGERHARAWAQEIERFDSRSAGAGLANRAVEGASSVDSQAPGRNFANGFIAGISSRYSAVYTAAYEMAMQAIRAANEAQQSASPSRVMMGVGGWFAEGYALGIERLAWMARDASDEMARGAIAAASGEYTARVAARQLPTGISRDDLREAMTLALTDASVNLEAAVYVDGRQLSSSIGRPMDTTMGTMQVQASRGLR